MMSWPVEPLVLPPELQQSIRNGKCVAYIGAGASVNEYGLWKEVVSKLYEYCCGCTRQACLPEEYLDMAEEAKNTSCNKYYTFFANHFGHSVISTNPLYRALLSCNFRSYLTTNLDPLLVQDARSANPPCRNGFLSYPHNLDRQYISKRAIYHLHGHVRQGTCPNDGEIVFSRSEYDQAYEPNSKLNRLLLDTLENDPMCFVGCSLEDPPLGRIIGICNQERTKRMKELQRQGNALVKPPARYVLLDKPIVMDKNSRFDQRQSQQALEEKEKFCEKLGIQVIWYMPASSKDHTVLREAFENLAGFPEMRPSIGWD